MRYLPLLSTFRITKSSRCLGQVFAIGLLSSTMSLAIAQEDAKPGSADSQSEDRSSTDEQRDGDSPRGAGRGEGNRPLGGRGIGGERPMGERFRMMQPGGMMISPIVAALDTDRDGALSAAEIENASKSLLTLDKDGDGKISRDEWDAGYRVFDVNGDGKITKSEFLSVSGYGFVFELLDTDNDGQITQK